MIRTTAVFLLIVVAALLPMIAVPIAITGFAFALVAVAAVFSTIGCAPAIVRFATASFRAPPSR